MSTTIKILKTMIQSTSTLDIIKPIYITIGWVLNTSIFIYLQSIEVTQWFTAATAIILFLLALRKIVMYAIKDVRDWKNNDFGKPEP